MKSIDYVICIIEITLFFTYLYNYNFNYATILSFIQNSGKLHNVPELDEYTKWNKDFYATILTSWCCSDVHLLNLFLRWFVTISKVDRVLILAKFWEAKILIWGFSDSQNCINIQFLHFWKAKFAILSNFKRPKFPIWSKLHLQNCLIFLEWIL